MNLNQVTLPVDDLPACCAFYRLLGFTQIVDTAHYARFECPEGGSTFSLHRTEHVPESGVVVYFECEELDDWCHRLVEQGIEFEYLPRDEPWLWREAALRDPAGNQLKLYWAGENRRHPPWRVTKMGSGPFSEENEPDPIFEEE